MSPQLPRWPGSPPIAFERRLDLERGDQTTDTTLRCSVHTGTHVDAPAHFLQDGPTVEAMPLDVLIGSATVVDVGEAEDVGVPELERAAIPARVQRLLLKTRNSRRWEGSHTGEFRRDYVALTAGAAHWIVNHRMGLVGVDCLSVQRFEDGPETHRMLLESGTVILEGLNLAGVTPGNYDLCCLPLKLAGVEGAPARAVLFPREADS